MQNLFLVGIRRRGFVDCWASLCVCVGGRGVLFFTRRLPGVGYVFGFVFILNCFQTKISFGLDLSRGWPRFGSMFY